MIKKILSALLFTSIVTAQFSTVTTFTGPAGSSQHAYVGQSDLSGAYSIITGITPVPSPVYGIFTPAGVNLQTAALVSPFETGAKYACDVDGDGIEDTLYGDSIVMALPTTINWIKNLGGTSGPIITSWVIPNPIAGLLTITSPAEILLEGYAPGDVFAYGSAMSLFPPAAYLMLSYITQAGGFTDLSPFAQPLGVPIITIIRLQKTNGLVVNAVGTPVGGIMFNYVFNYMSPAPAALVAVVAHTVPTDNITDFAIGDFSGDGWDDIAVLVNRVAPAYDVYLHTMVTGMYAIAGTTLISRPGAGPGLQASKIILSSTTVAGPVNKDISVISSAVAGALNPIVESTNNLFTTVTTTTLAPGTAMGPLQAVTKPSRYPNQEDIFVTAGTLHWLLEPSVVAPMSVSNYGAEPIQGAAQGLPYIGNSNFGFAMNGGIPGMPTMLGIGAVQHMPPIFVAPALNLYTTPLIWAPATVVNAYGWAGTNYAIPYNPALVGTVLYSQWFTANGLGQAVGSQGMTTIIY